MELLVSLTLALTLSQIVICQKSPAISDISETKAKGIGDSVELQCSVTFADDYFVLWTKISTNNRTEQIPLSYRSNLIIKDSRFSVREDKKLSSFTLQINDIQKTDAAIYVCQIVISANEKVTAEVELQVLQQPIISDNSTSSINVTEGHSVQLECYANGVPTPNITWRRNNNTILPTGSSIFRGNILKISSVRKEDRGTFFCIAENGVGHGNQRNISMNVKFAPNVTATRKRVGQALGYDMNLECHAEAVPPPIIVWMKDGQRLNNNQPYNISQFSRSGERTDSTITIIHIEKKQYGQYVCKAVNILGSAESTVELFETTDPVCPPACDKNQLNTGVILMSSGPLIVFTLIIRVALRNT